MGEQTKSDPRTMLVTLSGLCAGATAIIWLLGEVFARRRRLFLPAIAIVVALTAFAAVTVGAGYFGFVVGSSDGFTWNIGESAQVPPTIRIGILAAAATLIIAPLVFYARFRLPFSLGLAGAGFAMFVIAAAMLADLQTTLANLPALYLLLGGLLFLAGVGFDARDPMRTTRFSDNGFWLHFAAAPLILNGAFGLIAKAFTQSGTSATSIMVQNGSAAAPIAVATLMVVAVLGVLSMLINRRALIVSALLTTGIAIGILMNAVGLGAGALAASTLITLGAFVLILGAGWHGVRRALLSWVRPSGFWARVFPPEGAPI